MPLVLCCLAMMSLALAVNLLPVLLTTLSHDLSAGVVLSSEQLGRIGSVTCFGLVLGIVLTGPLADRLGARPFTTLGNGLIAVGLVLLAWAHSYAVLLWAALTLGLGAGVLDMILSPIVSALQPQRRTAALNLLHSFYCAGAVATILTATWALHVNVAWRGLALYLLPLPVLLAMAFLAAPLPALTEAGQSPTRVRSLARHPFFIAAMVAIFLGGSTEMGMAFWLPAYAEESLHFSRLTAGSAFLAFSLAMTVGRLAIPLVPLAHRRPVPLMLVCCAGAIVLFLMASFAPWPRVALGAAVLSGLAGSCLWPSTLAVAADRFPLGGATMFALLSASGNLGGTVIPWGIGALADRSSLHLGLASAALCPLLMIPALIYLGRFSSGAPVRAASLVSSDM